MLEGCLLECEKVVTKLAKIKKVGTEMSAHFSINVTLKPYVSVLHNDYEHRSEK